MSLAAFSPAAHLGEAEALASALPGLSIQARQVATSVRLGLHGRGKSGVGEQFWQFRPYQAGDARSAIDWRRSARAETAQGEGAIVREREWQVARVVRLWMDVTQSLRFSSLASGTTKSDCALVLGLALAQILVQGGERVALMGGGPASGGRDIIERLGEMLAQAEAVAGNGQTPSGMQPVLTALPPLAAGRGFRVWISDFLLPLPQLQSALKQLAAQGDGGVLIRVFDPQEERFGFRGHVEFADAQARAKLRLGRAESVQERYEQGYQAHCAGVQALARAVGWDHAAFCTDQSKAGFLLMLAQRLMARGAS